MTLTLTARTATHAALLQSSRVTLRLPAPFRPVRGPGPVRMAKSTAVALSQDELKKQAAHRAVEYAKSGMVLGLGTGSTTAYAIDRIGELLKNGELKDIIGVPTSIKSYEQASGKHVAVSASCGADFQRDGVVHECYSVNYQHTHVWPEGRAWIWSNLTIIFL